MLGSDLFLKLNMGYEVVGLDKEEIDIVSASECEEAIKEIKPDIVINAAAYTNVDGCETAKDECFAVNAEAIKISALFISARIMFLTEPPNSLTKKIINAIRSILTELPKWQESVTSDPYLRTIF